MKPIKKTMTLIVFLFSLCFPLASCQKQYGVPDYREHNWINDSKQYVNYEKIYVLEQKKKYVDIDFLKDVFPNGEIVDQNGEKYALLDKYDTVLLLTPSRPEIFTDKRCEYLGPMKIRVRISDQIEFRFVNTKTYQQSERMKLGHIRFADKKEFVHIKEVKDFEKIKDESIVCLEADIDFTDHGLINENRTLFPKSFGGVFLNPEKHVLKNINITSVKQSELAFISRTSRSAWYDSLIIDNVRYKNYDESLGNGQSKFALVSNYSYDTLFKDLKISNFSCDGNDFYLSTISNECYNCDFINCEVSGKIQNRYQPDPKLKDAIFNKPLLMSRTSGICGEFLSTFYSERSDRFEQDFTNYYKDKSDANLTQLKEDLESLSSSSTIKNVRVDMDITGYGKTGSFCVSGDKFLDLTTDFSSTGKLEGLHTGTLAVDNYFYQIDGPVGKLI